MTMRILVHLQRILVGRKGGAMDPLALGHIALWWLYLEVYHSAGGLLYQSLDT
jgi:hypothetical protein